MAKKPDKRKHKDINVPDEDIKLDEGQSFKKALKDASKTKKKK